MKLGQHFADGIEHIFEHEQAAEHDASEWVTLDEALRRLPFKGLRVAAQRALEIL